MPASYVPSQQFSIADAKEENTAAKEVSDVFQTFVFFFQQKSVEQSWKCMEQAKGALPTDMHIHLCCVGMQVYVHLVQTVRR